MATPLRLLIVDDSEEDVLQVVRLLRCGGYEPFWKRVQTEPEFRFALENDSWDVVLAEFSLPQFGSMAALKTLEAMRLDTPVLIVAGLADERTTLGVFEAGAKDYIPKGNLARLLPSVRRELARVEAKRNHETAQEALRNSEATVRALLECASQGIISTDSQGRMVVVNAMAEQLFGYRREELYGQPIELLVPEASRQVHGAHVKGYFAQPRRRPMGLGIDLAGRRKDGTEFPVEISLGYVHAKEGITVVAFITDISERKLALETLLESEQRLELALQGADLALWDWNIVTDRVVFNRRWTEMLGYEAAEVVPSIRFWEELMHADDRRRVIELRNAHLANESPFYEAEYRMRTKSGEWKWFLDRGKVVERDPSGAPLRAAGTPVDITRRKLADQKLSEYVVQVEQARQLTERQAAELAAQSEQLTRARDEALSVTRHKSEFLASMSHEIRTPMNGIVGMIDLLLETGLTPLQREYTETIRTSAQSLLAIINDILDFSKIESGKLTVESLPIDLWMVIEDVATLLRPNAQRKGLDLRVSYPPHAPRRFLGDYGRIRQVLLNLAGNALKFTEKGHIRISVTAEAGSGRLCPVCVRVEDTGIGIPEDKLDIIFGKFTQADSSTTRRYGGSGLGLAISQQLVELMQGSIGVESTTGEGSTFWFRLPLVIDSETEAALVHEPGLRSLSPSRVLLVEDNLINQMVAQSMLLRLGCQVEVASNGKQTLEMLTRDSYDLVLMDCQMPEMDGYQTTREIRKLAPRIRRIPVIAMTACAMEGDREACLAAGMDDYLSKPFRLEDLAHILQRWNPAPRR